MTDPSLTFSIDRTSLTLSPLLLTGHADPARVLSIRDFREPALQARIAYAPDGDEHGSQPLGWSYQEAVLAFTVFAALPTSESDARAAIAELAAAVGRLSYTTTVTVNDASAETWTCRPGSIEPVDGRSLPDMRNHLNVWSVTIPVYPIRSA